MDIISESSTAEASQGLIHYIVDKKVARWQNVPCLDPTSHAYVSPYPSQPLYGKISPQHVVENCQGLGNEVWLLAAFETDSAAITDSTSSEM